MRGCNWDPQSIWDPAQPEKLVVNSVGGTFTSLATGGGEEIQIHSLREYWSITDPSRDQRRQPVSLSTTYSAFIKSPL